MKKVMSINLGGFAFKIDEDAYLMLEQYINSIKSKFRDEREKNEIIGDIEFRISEIFTKNLKDNFKEVIAIAEVEEMIKKLGKPETIAGEEEQGSATDSRKESFSSNEPNEKRIFRNPDDKVISGICSGMSAYFGINDPIWLRITFAIFLFISFGTMALIYIIGMIIIPEANTTSQKLQMKGKPVTLQNIEDSFSSVKDTINNHNVSNGISSLIYMLVKIIKYFVAAILILVGFSALTAFTIAMVTGNLSHLHGGPFNYLHYLVDDTTGISMFFISLYILVAIPCISLILLGIRVIINRTFMTIPVRILMLSIWILAMMMMFYTARKGAKMFSSKATIEETIPMNLSSKMLVIKSTGKMDVEFDLDEITINGQQLKNGKLILPNTKLDIVKSPNGTAFLERVVKSNGQNKEEAEKNSQEVISKIQLSDSVLFIDQWFEINNAKPKFRNQNVRYYLNLPVGAKIYLHSSAESLLYDIKNVHEMRDSKMYGHQWIMTENGLECLDCSTDEKMRYSINYDEEENNESDDMEKRIIKKIIKSDVHIKDGEEEVIIKDGKITVRDGNEEKVIVIDHEKNKKE